MAPKKGFTHFVVLFLLIALGLIFLLTPLKKYIYLAYQTVGLKAGVNLNDIASQSYVDFIKSQNGQFENNQSVVWLNQKFLYNNYLVEDPKRNRRAEAIVLGEQSPPDDNKWIEIDLSEQTLYMKEGTNTIASFLVSTGKWAPTPTGEWRIWTKLRYTRMTGGSQALGTYYNLPSVPYTMYYYQGYGIHGAYWHNNFGKPMSHGCVNMRPEEAGIVFNWADVGTRVVVHD